MSTSNIFTYHCIHSFVGADLSALTKEAANVSINRIFHELSGKAFTKEQNQPHPEEVNQHASKDQGEKNETENVSSIPTYVSYVPPWKFFVFFFVCFVFLFFVFFWQHMPLFQYNGVLFSHYILTFVCVFCLAGMQWMWLHPHHESHRWLHRW